MICYIFIHSLSPSPSVSPCPLTPTPCEDTGRKWPLQARKPLKPSHAFTWSQTSNPQNWEKTNAIYGTLLGQLTDTGCCTTSPLARTYALGCISLVAVNSGKAVCTMGPYHREHMAAAGQSHMGVPRRTVVQRGDPSEKEVGSISVCSLFPGIGLPSVIACGLVGCSGILTKKKKIYSELGVLQRHLCMDGPLRKGTGNEDTMTKLKEHQSLGGKPLVVRRMTSTYYGC